MASFCVILWWLCLFGHIPMRRDGVRPGFQQFQRLADSVVVSDGHQADRPSDALTSARPTTSIPSISARKLLERFRSRVKCRAMRRAADTFWNSGIKRSISAAGRFSASGSRNLACRPRFCSACLSNASARETNGAATRRAALAWSALQAGTRFGSL